MSSIIEILYDSYAPKLRIKINGKQVSDYSQLIQFADEYIWCWYDKILDIAYSEIREDFSLSFTGGEEEGLLMGYAARKNCHCLQYEKRQHIVSKSLKKRLGELNQIIKRNGLKLPLYQVPCHFHFTSVWEKYRTEILELNIENLFCTVKFCEIRNEDFNQKSEHTYCFMLESDENSALMHTRPLEGKYTRPVFVLIPSEKSEFYKAEENFIFMRVNENELQEVIFRCILTFPLAEAFVYGMQNLSRYKELNAEIRKIRQIEPMVQILADDSVELGRSIPFTIQMDPPVCSAPPMIYKFSDETIASCNGLCVFGLKEGNSRLDVFIKGEAIPCYSKTIKVYKRNRIKDILIDEDEISLGIGDIMTLNMHHFPENADNVKDIKWKSSHPEVLHVDNHGRIRALKAGTGRIICTAENVSAQCSYVVKPYLENFTVNLADESETIMCSGEEKKLDIILNPPDCIDSSIQITSSDLLIVNIVNRTLQAKTPGDATVVVTTNSKRIQKKFCIRVVKKHSGSDQNGFLHKIASIFGGQ